MKQFKKGDQEYNENGYYTIEGIDYMSIWTYKNKNNFDKSKNSNSINGNEAIEMLNEGIHFYNSKPDFGGFSEIKIFPVSDLRGFYSLSECY